MVHAVLLGGTGATGKELLSQMLQDEAFKRIVTIGRRTVPLTPEQEQQAAGRLQQQAVDMDKMEEAAPHFAGADVVFCTLGTTRKVAGSAAVFKKVDYEYVAKSAEIAKQQGVKHYSLVTAGGANANVWANDSALFHPLLYMRTKGMAEQAVIRQGFERVSIFRPGMLDRGELMRPVERAFLRLLPAHKMPDLARSMLADARRPDARPGVAIFSQGALFKSAASKQAPVP